MTPSLQLPGDLEKDLCSVTICSWYGMDVSYDAGTATQDCGVTLRPEDNTTLRLPLSPSCSGYGTVEELGDGRGTAVATPGERRSGQHAHCCLYYPTVRTDLAYRLFTSSCICHFYWELTERRRFVSC